MEEWRPVREDGVQFHATAPIAGRASAESLPKGRLDPLRPGYDQASLVQKPAVVWQHRGKGLAWSG